MTGITEIKKGFSQVILDTFRDKCLVLYTSKGIDYLVDNAGNYLVDNNGNYLTVQGS